MTHISHLTDIHLIGIGGIGMRALARIFAERGVRVTGSDAAADITTEPLATRGEVTVFHGHHEEHLPREVECAVFSSAVPPENPERKAARERGIREVSYTEMLGELMEGYHGIAVSGTNGKTTTTALLAVLWEVVGRDPLAIVGGVLGEWDSNVRTGNGGECIVEACEYKRNMLHLAPDTIVLTNIEADHLDYYTDLDDIIDAFREYVSRVPESGSLVYCSDDPVSRSVAAHTSAQTVSYGTGEEADFVLEHIAETSEGMAVRIAEHGTQLPEYVVPLHGGYNAYNIAAAVATARQYGIDAEAIGLALAQFRGVGRRFETVGAYHGTPVISDYAHHPRAVAETIAAARRVVPEGRVLSIFQPHQHERTHHLFAEFRDALSGADDLIIAEIYGVTGREDSGASISANDLVRAVNETRDDGRAVTYASGHEAVKQQVRDHADEYDLILFMGAGDIDACARQLVQESGEVSTL